MEEDDHAEPSLSPEACTDPSGSQAAQESNKKPAGSAGSCDEEVAPLLQPAAATSPEEAGNALPPPEGSTPEEASASPLNGTPISHQNLHFEGEG